MNLLRWQALCLIPLTVVACRGEDKPDTMCVDQAAAFEEEAAGDGELLDDVVEDGPYVVSMVLSEQGLNKLLDGVIDQDVPFTGEVPFGIIAIGFEPTSEPEIRLEELPDCPTCIIYSLEFNVELDQKGQPLSSGVGDVQLQIPLSLRTNGDESTTLVAHYDEITIEEFNMSAFGFSSEDHATLSSAIQVLLTETIQETYQPTDLLTLESWDIGEGAIKLLTRRLLIFPEENTMALAMGTNLALPEARGLDRDGELPEGVDLGFRFETELLEGMARRMLAEGEIARRYDSDGAADPEGIYGVTLDTIDGNTDGGSWLDVRFRAWRTDLGYCGNAAAQVPMAVAIDDGSLDIEAGEVLVLEGEGSGRLATEDDAFVDDNRHIVDSFNSALSDTLSDTLSYDSLAIEGSTIIFDAVGVDVGADTVTTHVDFLVLANE